MCLLKSNRILISFSVELLKNVNFVIKIDFVSLGIITAAKKSLFTCGEITWMAAQRRRRRDGAEGRRERGREE